MHSRIVRSCGKSPLAPLRSRRAHGNFLQHCSELAARSFVPVPTAGRRKILLCHCSPRCRRDRSIWLCTARIACHMRLGRSWTPPLCGLPTGSLGLCPKTPSLRPWSEGRPWSPHGQLLWGVSSSVWLSPPKSGGVSPSGGGLLPLLAVLARSVSLCCFLW